MLVLFAGNFSLQTAAMVDNFVNILNTNPGTNSTTKHTTYLIEKTFSMFLICLEMCYNLLFPQKMLLGHSFLVILLGITSNIPIPFHSPNISCKLYFR